MYCGGKMLLIALLLAATSTSPTNAALFRTSLGHTMGPCCPCPPTVPNFVAVGINALATSDDGATWTAVTVPAGQWKATAFGGGVYCSITDDLARASMHSYDGATWTLGGALPGTATATYSALIWDGAQFVAVGLDAFASPQARIVTSSDCLTWSSVTPVGFAANYKPQSIAFSGTAYAIAGFNTNPNNVYHSTDLINWTTHAVANIQYSSMDYGGGTFVAASNSNGFVAVSTDNGANWSVVSSGRTTLVFGNGGIRYSPAIWEVASSGGFNHATNPSSTWIYTAVNSASGGIAYGNGMFVGVGNLISMVSTDGLAWSTYALPLNARGVAAKQ